MTLYCITLLYTTLHYITLHCIALHQQIHESALPHIISGPDTQARWLTHTHTLVTTRLNPACRVAHCCAPQDQCVPRPHETTRAHPCQACCMLYIASARPRYGLATANQILGPWDCTCVTGMAYAYDHLKTL